jgi:spore germination cell wall hydrolase CwlJ-like protein
MGSRDLRQDLLQDPPARAARPVPSGGFRAHFLASPFGTIHAATFDFPQPVGTAVPDSPEHHLSDGALPAGPGDQEFLQIDRSLKGPRLVPRAGPDLTSSWPATIDAAVLLPASRPAAAQPATADVNDDAAADRLDAADRGTVPDDADLIYGDPDTRETAEPTLMNSDGAMARVARIYFATTSPAATPWPAEAPLFSPPPGETIAGQGEVTGEDRRPKTPAERLGLTGAARSKHEKCLADAVYFEARGEPIRGQMAVAQVVINRVFSGYYPNNVCGVVYQNAHRHLRCQFTFACDGIPERITEPEAWERAKHIAREALDGSFWLNDVGKATHYHARWVHPWWVREMRRLDRIGVHTFYRPRKWGDGAGAPVWGDAQATAAAANAQ